MELKNTVIISNQDLKSAKKLLKNLLQEKETLLMIVLGNDEQANTAITAADVRAGAVIQGFKRKVAWIQDKNLFETLYDSKSIPPGNSGFTIDQLDNVIALSISLDKIIKDVIKTGDTIDPLRIEQAFLAAGT